MGQGNLASVILDLITLSSDPTIYSDPSGKSIVTDLLFLEVLALQNKPFKLVFKLFFSKTNSDLKTVTVFPHIFSAETILF